MIIVEMKRRRSPTSSNVQFCRVGTSESFRRIHSLAAARSPGLLGGNICGDAGFSIIIPPISISSAGSFLAAKKIFTQTALNTVYSRRELA